MRRNHTKRKAEEPCSHPANRHRGKTHPPRPTQALTTEEVDYENVAGRTDDDALADCLGEGHPSHWSGALLRTRLEERGLTLPAGMKKAQLLLMCMDNFYDIGNEG